MSQTVIGIFESANDAQQAVQHLTSSGIARENVDVANRTVTDTDRDDDNDTGFGESISNFFGSLFGDDDDTRNKYSEVARRGYTVTVHASTTDEAESAARILDNYGAVDVDEKATQYRSSYGSDRNFSSEKSYSDNDIANRTIPVIEENLEVGKREVEGGSARLNSRIIEKPVEESIRLRSERINIERNAVNRPATTSDFDTFEEGSIELTERKEVPVVNKQARVVEEISLNKEVEENEETIRDTVRHTEVDIERTDDEYRNDNRSSSYGNDRDLI